MVEIFKKINALYVKLERFQRAETALVMTFSVLHYLISNSVINQILIPFGIQIQIEVGY